MATPSTPPPLLPVRAALILLLGLIVGAAAGALTFAAGGTLPAAALAGTIATGGAITWAHQLIGA